jgi:preprotein translocase subunit SecF
MVISYSQFQAPLRPGLDFIGGTRLQLELDCSVAGNCDRPIDSAKVRDLLSEQNLGDSSIQVIENYSLSIRSKTLNVDQRTQLEASLNQKIGKFEPQKTQIDTVGPAIGRELFVAGMLALIVSFFGITVYLSFRFQFDYAFFAIVALFHDVLITTGIFAILGLVIGVEVDSLFLVSLLTIIGFSVNDTVVIYDRIRENLTKFPDLSFNETVDNAVNQTLARSINTTLTALFPLVAIFFLGGATLKYFALALIIGFLAGAYSSIFIASTLLALWRNRQTNA